MLVGSVVLHCYISVVYATAVCTLLDVLYGKRPLGPLFSYP